MRTGINVLLEKNGLTADEIDQVVIAGAFGTYIDIAQRGGDWYVATAGVGSLPAGEERRWDGATLALISRSRRSATQALPWRIGYVDMLDQLATTPDRLF